jgi:hypothetical protein
MGRVVVATDVDHIIDSRDDFTDDNSRENLQPLCHECHSLKTASSMGKSIYLGCDVSGMPIDPGHPWNKITSSQASPERRGSLLSSLTAKPDQP